MVSSMHSDEGCISCEEAYHYSLEQEYNELMQEVGFCCVRLDILKIMQEQLGIEIKYEHYRFIREIGYGA